MKNYGKIVIMADSIEQAQAELDTIKALVGMGATCGMGEVEITEEVVVEVPRVNGIMADRMTETYAENRHCCCPCCCCEDYAECLNEPVEINGEMVSRFIAEVMGL